MFYKEVNGLSGDKQKDYVQDSINNQVVQLFSILHNQEEIKKFGKKYFDVEEVGHCHSNESLKKLPFSLTCKQSTIPNAGQGVFISGFDNLIASGTVVSLYPGIVHLKENIRDSTYFRSLLPDDNLMLMARYDCALIDARAANKVPVNPIALAHLVNHCGKDRRPNVMAVSFDYPSVTDLFPSHLQRFIPNQYAQPLSLLGKLETAFCCMKGSVLISCQPLEEGDELFMDYRLNPTSHGDVNSTGLPAWYEPYDVDEALMRWGGNTEQ